LKWSHAGASTVPVVIDNCERGLVSLKRQPMVSTRAAQGTRRREQFIGDDFSQKGLEEQSHPGGQSPVTKNAVTAQALVSGETEPAPGVDEAHEKSRFARGPW
jgi:hypothetical protein